jgi:hypothetical protein
MREGSACKHRGVGSDGFLYGMILRVSSSERSLVIVSLKRRSCCPAFSSELARYAAHTSGHLGPARVVIRVEQQNED